MSKLNPWSSLSAKEIAQAGAEFGSPIYLYDEAAILDKCKLVQTMPNAYGLRVRYAMKANSNRRLLQTLHAAGLWIDASSLNEAKRAELAGIALSCIMLTTQEVPVGAERADLERMVKGGMKYNVCSLRQLQLIGPFAKEHGITLSIRLHPGVGSGESASRNTGDEYSCFGVHLSHVEEALAYAKEMGLVFDQVHEHIGSGGDPEVWRQNIDLELSLVEKYFPDAHTVNFGGGLKEARMPGDVVADVQLLGNYAKERVEAFYERTGRKLTMEIEPGTFIVANSGYLICEVLDKKDTGEKGFRFVILDGGMEVNARPLVYGSQHPFYVVDKSGALLSSEFAKETLESGYCAVPVGRCCESGDAQSLGDDGKILPRAMAEPAIGDFVVVGGAGAYCASMTPFNYNSHTQVAELLYTVDGELRLIRRAQTLEQVLENEL